MRAFFVFPPSTAFADFTDCPRYYDAFGAEIMR